MPRTAITVGWNAKGEATVLADPAVPIGDQVRTFAGYKTGKMPAGMLRIDRWESDKGIVATALSKAAHQAHHDARVARDADDAKRLEKQMAFLNQKKKGAKAAGPARETAAQVEKPGRARAKVSNAPKVSEKEPAPDPAPEQEPASDVVIEE